MTREIDTQIARALGWTVRTCTETPTGKTLYELIDPCAKPRNKHAFYTFTAHYSEDRAWDSAPHYSTDIAAAWTLIEYMIEHGYLYGLGNLEYQGPLHEAAFYRDGIGPVYAEAETPAAAISAAFLKAVEAK